MLVIQALSIGIPIRMRENKCMIVYTVGESESVKIDAVLPQIPGKLPEEYYQVAITNT